MCKSSQIRLVQLVLLHDQFECHCWTVWLVWVSIVVDENHPLLQVPHIGVWGLELFRDITLLLPFDTLQISPMMVVFCDSGSLLLACLCTHYPKSSVGCFSPNLPFFLHSQLLLHISENTSPAPGTESIQHLHYFPTSAVLCISQKILPAQSYQAGVHLEAVKLFCPINTPECFFPETEPPRLSFTSCLHHRWPAPCCSQIPSRRFQFASESLRVSLLPSPYPMNHHFYHLHHIHHRNSSAAGRRLYYLDHLFSVGTLMAAISLLGGYWGVSEVRQHVLVEE